MKKNKLSSRELGLLVFLGLIVLGFCYYRFFYLNVTSQIATLKADMEMEQTQTATLSARVGQVDAMRESVDEAKSGALSEPIPAYDNGKNVIKELNKILASTENYSLNFYTLTHNDYIAERPVQINFTSASYKAARAIISRLNSSEYFNQISDVSFNMAQGTYDEEGNYNCPCSVTLTITYFEVDG